MEVSFGLECANLTIRALPLIGLTVMVMIGYALTFLAWETRLPRQTQALTVVCAAFIPAAASISSFGIFGYIGLPLNVLSILVPFLVLAVGIDAMFVMSTAAKEVEVGSAL